VNLSAPNPDDRRWREPSDRYKPVPPSLEPQTELLNIPEYLADHLRHLGYTVIPPWPVNPYDNFWGDEK